MLVKGITDIEMSQVVETYTQREQYVCISHRQWLGCRIPGEVKWPSLSAIIWSAPRKGLIKYWFENMVRICDANKIAFDIHIACSMGYRCALCLSISILHYLKVILVYFPTHLRYELMKVITSRMVMIERILVKIPLIKILCSVADITR